jgi:hypothetical protein
MGWQRELVDATQRSRDIVYTWDETVAELASEEVINLPSSKPSDSHVCTLDTVTTFPYTPQMEQVLQQKIYDLTELELRAHPSWHPTLELYRSALAELIKDKNAVQAQKLFLQAREVRVAEMADHQKLVDYINWFEVTRDYPGVTTHFETYFKTAHELEQAEANPAHPNPIREDVLHVESQL